MIKMLMSFLNLNVSISKEFKQVKRKSFLYKKKEKKKVA